MIIGAQFEALFYTDQIEMSNVLPEKFCVLRNRGENMVSCLQTDVVRYFGAKSLKLINTVTGDDFQSFLLILPHLQQ